MPSVTARFLAFVLALVALAPVGVSIAQIPVADEPAWTARWIRHPDDDGESFGVWHFRRAFDLASVPATFVIRVSADNRYRLFVNGMPVSEGPARGDLMNWRYESVDLAPFLRAGRNVLAAVVWNFAGLRPEAQFTRGTGFLLQGPTGGTAPPGSGAPMGAAPPTAAADLVDSGPDWKVLRSEAYAPIPVTREMVGGAYIVVGPGEEVRADRYAWGWQTPEFDDGAWAAARPVRAATEHLGENYGGYSGWKLVPRTIPPMERRGQRFAKVARASGVDVPYGFVEGSASLTIPPRSAATILLDQGELTTAYPELTTRGGAGARIDVTYAEALVDERGTKGNRNEIGGKRIRGYRDSFLPDGGAARTFRPLWWRTFRYVQLDVTTGDEPVVIEDFRSEFTAYPFEERGRFAAGDTLLAAIWDTGWHTARLCAGETYFDCPYYEQLQYVGDTRIQALISLYVSGDDRLMRKAIQLFDDSRIPEGLTQSRYPAHGTQFIPPYSLFWIAMVHDYWMHRRDDAFVEPKLLGIRGIVDWYARLLDEDSMVGPAPWWSFVDWAFSGGVPPGGIAGASSIVTLQYAYVLRYAEELARAFGRTGDADHYAAIAERVRRGTMRRAWDAKRGLVADTPRRETFSQHASILAVLSGAVPKEEQRAVVERVLSDTTLTPAGFYFRFYLHRAMQQVGLADRYVPAIAPWRDMLDLGLTTFAEKEEPTRSDAHAWSASPNYFLLSLVCGIRPASPGFETVRIEPALGPLEWAECTVPHPAGDLVVRLERTGTGGVTADVTLPDGLAGRIEWKGAERALAPGRQSVRF